MMICRASFVRSIGVVAVLVAMVGCGGDDDGPPAEPMVLDGLDGEVTVDIDERGIPHIYGATLHDVLVVEGYLMAQDRFAQMEFIRRSVLGRLAEVAGGLSPGLIDDDREQRWQA